MSRMSMGTTRCLQHESIQLLIETQDETVERRVAGAGVEEGDGIMADDDICHVMLKGVVVCPATPFAYEHGQ